jgi:hypothetical protein
MGWVARANEVVATLALQGTRLTFMLGDDCIITCNGLSASDLQLQLSSSGVWQELLLILAIWAPFYPKWFPRHLSS